MAGPNLFPFRFNLRADWLGERASGMQRHPLGISVAAATSFCSMTSLRSISGWSGKAAVNKACVYGCSGCAEQLLGFRQLHQAAEIHDADHLAHVAHGSEMMGNEQIAEALVLLQRLEQVHDLGADRDVERGNGLVEHNQAWRRRERAGDRHALTLAAAEFVREVVDIFGPKADLMECGLRPLAPFLPADARIQEQRFGDEAADPQARDSWSCRGPGRRPAPRSDRPASPARRFPPGFAPAKECCRWSVSPP